MISRLELLLLLLLWGSLLCAHGQGSRRLHQTDQQRSPYPFNVVNNGSTVCHMRIGFSEGFLLMIHVAQNRLGVKLSKNLQNQHKARLSFLYTTSGFYDRQVSGSKFHYNTKQILDSPVYKQYMETLINVLSNQKMSFSYFAHRETDVFFPKVLHYLNITSAEPSRDDVFAYLNNKKVLLVSSFAELIRQQIVSGNPQHIYSDFPRIIDSVAFTTPYTFFNNMYGDPNDLNYFDTLRHITDGIAALPRDSFDVALVSAGSYGALITDFIATHLGKHAMTIGGEMTNMFGILNHRDLEWFAKHKKPIDHRYWITEIPESYKPKDYKDIEGGCYW